MSDKENAKSIFDITSGKLRFMLISIFGNETAADEIMTKIYSDVFSATEAPTAADVFAKAAEICFNQLGVPEKSAAADFSVEDMHSFFESCENFSTPVPDEGVAAVDALNALTDTLDPVSKLIVCLRMCFDMTIDEISCFADNSEAVITALFNAYRSIMPNAAQICMSTPSLQGLPVLQLVRISLLKQSFNTKTPDCFFDGLFTEPYSNDEQPVTETEQSSIEDIYSDSHPNDNTMKIPSDFVVDPIADFESPEWSYVKNKFGFDFSDDKSMRFSEAYSLIAQGYTYSAKEILFSINRDAPNAASFLGLLMIDAGASSPDDLLHIHIDYAVLPSFKAADYYGNSQLKDFLGNLLSSRVHPQPTKPTVAPVESPQAHKDDIPKVPVENTDKPADSKKSNTGLIIGIIAGVAVLAIAAVVAILFATGMISIPDKNNVSEETVPLVEETNATEELATIPPVTTAPHIANTIAQGTSTVTIDRMEENKFEFRPTQSGYYAFVSEEYNLDLAAELYSGSSRIAYDDDSGNNTNFMVIAYCEAFTPVTLSVFEIENGSGTADVTLTIYKLSDSEGEALKKYCEYCQSRITITPSETLYFDHSFDSSYTYLSSTLELIPDDYYIDENERILWLAFMSEYDGESGYIWYPKEY